MAARHRLLVLAGVTLLAALLRLPTLGLQSLWSDEAVTATVLDTPLDGLLAAVRDSESTPPLFYVLAWPVVRLLGDGEAALRLVPALCSIAAVPVLALAGERLGGTRALLATGLLAATSPLLVWFGQEARAYALLLLLAALATLAFLDRRPLAWGLAAAAALATHFFAVFLLVPQAVLLARALPDRRARLRALGPPALAGLALLPLLAHQRAAGRAGFIGDIPLPERTAAVVKQWLIGFDAPAEVVLTVAAGLLVALAVAGLRRTDRRGLDVVLAVSLALPLVAALVGDDYVLTRNLLASLAVALPLAGAGLARARPAAVIALVAVWLAVAAGPVLDPGTRREDWRAAMREVGPPADHRIVAVLPPSGRPAALRYLQGPSAELRAPTAVREIDIVQIGSRASGTRRPLEPLPPQTGVPVPAGFTVTKDVDRDDGWRVVRWSAPAPVPVAPALLDSVLPPVLLLDQPG
jgi:4-amino-4-deoxy-L-arabinose transferase-like glycosyltransferase